MARFAKLRLGNVVKNFIIRLGIILTILIHPAFAQQTGAPFTLTAQLDSIVKHIGDPDIGVVAKNLNTGEIIYSYNANQSYIPASNLKIFTAVAALEYLTPIYQYPTIIASQKPTLNQGILTGDLYLVFSGDPSLTKDDVKDLLQQLKNQGVTQINGNLYVDDFHFDQDIIVPVTLPEDQSFCFSAPIAANNLDSNCVGVNVKPGDKVGDLAKIQVVNSATSINLINQIVTAQKAKCGINAKPDGNNNYVLDGCINKNVAQQYFTLSVQNTRHYTIDILKGLLRDLNIQLNGYVLFEPLPPDTTTIAVHQSEPLANLVKHMLKESDNVYANSILKTLGYYYFKQQASWQNGVAAVNAILTQNHQVDLSSAILSDGAGLSRQNMVSANQMMQVLESAYQHSTILDALLYGLPIGGVDGTLKGRFTETGYRSRVHAKTGTMSMTGISSLSGYVLNNKNQTVAFSILINGKPAHIGTYRNAEDAICKILISAN